MKTDRDMRRIPIHLPIGQHWATGLDNYENCVGRFVDRVLRFIPYFLDARNAQQL